MKAELNEYVPARRQTMEPGRLAAAAPRNVLGDEGLLPEFWSSPEGEAYTVQLLEQGP
jgi:hypothetical protein